MQNKRCFFFPVLNNDRIWSKFPSANFSKSHCMSIFKYLPPQIQHSTKEMPANTPPNMEYTHQKSMSKHFIWQTYHFTSPANHFLMPKEGFALAQTRVNVTRCVQHRQRYRIGFSSRGATVVSTGHLTAGRAWVQRQHPFGTCVCVCFTLDFSHNSKTGMLCKLVKL